MIMKWLVNFYLIQIKEMKQIILDKFKYQINKVNSVIIIFKKLIHSNIKSKKNQMMIIMKMNLNNMNQEIIHIQDIMND